ncbi:MAG TPA: methylmalonyl Co-A mutase-associated GTPase MeaB, partial [Thermoplasmata archaeon]|nr:methylmalonyl Co-A mutase-associated GTPase MeaB [Thermoplasmata archaeon]
VVFVETVGAGQAEVDIVRTSHTTVVVDVPGLGDDVQVLKAGLMEIGDVFAVNKADLPDADRLVVQIESLLSLVDRDGWVPPVVKTVGHDVTTLVRLREMIDRHRAHEDGDMAASRRRTMADHRVRMLLEARLLDLVMERVGTARYAAVVDGVVSREMDPYTAVQKLVEGAL